MGPEKRVPPLQELFILPLSLQLGEQLKQLVPASGLTVMDLEVEGTCVRFSPLMTAAGNRSPWVACDLVLGPGCGAGWPSLVIFPFLAGEASPFPLG